MIAGLTPSGRLARLILGRTMEFTFNRERTCPACKATFAKANRREEFDAAIVVECPKCKALLWRPGSDENSDLFPYNASADEGGI